MSNTVDYIRGAELPDPGVTWYDEFGGLVDFTSGWTFEVKVGSIPDMESVIIKTAGISGAATAPNLFIVWQPAELDVLPVGLYVLQIFARNTASGKDRSRQALLRIRSAVA